MTTSTIQTNGNHHYFFIGIPILDHILVHSIDKSHDFIVVFENIFFPLCSNAEQGLLGWQDLEEATQIKLLSLQQLFSLIFIY